MVFDFFAVEGVGYLCPSCRVESVQGKEGGAGEGDAFVCWSVASILSWIVLENGGKRGAYTTYPNMTSGFGIAGFEARKVMMVWA